MSVDEKATVQLFNVFLDVCLPPPMRESPTAVEDLPGEAGPRWRWHGFPLLRLGSFVLHASSAGGCHRSPLFVGSGWGWVILESLASTTRTTQHAHENKGRLAPPKRTNFWGNSKGPLNPPHFRKIILQFFPKSPLKSAV